MNAVVITGAASGIGLALSQLCLKKGMYLIMVDKNLSVLEKEAQMLLAQYPNRVTPIPCDVSNEDEVKTLAKKTKALGHQIFWVFNNAGIIGELAPVWALKTEQIKQVMDVNLYGMIHIIQAFTPLLFEQNNPSRIINIASLYALCSGSQMASYAMSKHAVLALSESLYFDLKRLEKPVEVSVVCPSFTDTSLLSREEPENVSGFHNSLNALLAHSRPAIEVAEHIIHEIEQNTFYILPDKEVKGYATDRTQAIVQQTLPDKNNIEKLMESLIKRNMKLR